MRKLLLASLASLALLLGTSGTAHAAQPPPQCDPGACIDPLDVVTRAVCYVGEQLGFHCID